jgi:hypothetical protein
MKRKERSTIPSSPGNGTYCSRGRAQVNSGYVEAAANAAVDICLRKERLEIISSDSFSCNIIAAGPEKESAKTGTAAFPKGSPLEKLIDSGGEYPTPQSAWDFSVYGK